MSLTTNSKRSRNFRSSLLFTQWFFVTELTVINKRSRFISHYIISWTIVLCNDTITIGAFNKINETLILILINKKNLFRRNFASFTKADLAVSNESHENPRKGCRDPHRYVRFRKSNRSQRRLLILSESRLRYHFCYFIYIRYRLPIGTNYVILAKRCITIRRVSFFRSKIASLFFLNFVSTIWISQHDKEKKWSNGVFGDFVTDSVNFFETIRWNSKNLLELKFKIFVW